MLVFVFKETLFCRYVSMVTFTFPVGCVWYWTAQTLGSWVRIPFEAYIYVCVFLCCAKVQALGWADPPSKSPTKCLNGFVVSDIILSLNRPQGLQVRDTSNSFHNVMERVSFTGLKYKTSNSRIEGPMLLSEISLP
jgi:hypothetical protein